MQEKMSFFSDGLKLSAVLHVPEGRQPGQKLPAFIVLHGFVGSKDESHAEIQAKMLENMGYAALRFDFRCCGESEGERGQVRCFDQVADAKNALSFLAGREEVDPQRIGVIGHSFGAAVAVYSAGIDDLASFQQGGVEAVIESDFDDDARGFEGLPGGGGDGFQLRRVAGGRLLDQHMLSRFDGGMGDRRELIVSRRHHHNINVFPADRITWIASQLVDAVWLMKRVTSMPRTRYGPT